MGKLTAVLNSALLISLATLLACSGGSNAYQPSPDIKPPLSVELQQALSELDALPAAQGVAASSFILLKAALRRLLIERGTGKFTSAAPGSARSKVPDLTVAAEGASARFHWSYRNEGDFNQDSVVSVADVMPLGLHFGKNTASPDWATAQVADGNGNGQADLPDLVSIGANYLNRVTRYGLQHSDTSDAGGTWTPVAEIDFAASTVPAGQLRQFDYLLSDPQDGFYRIVPFDNDLAGIASDPAQWTSPSQIQPDTLYAIPEASVATVGQPVTIRVVTGQPAHPLNYLSSVALTVETAAAYVPDSFNIGDPGGAWLDTDGYWALMGPPAPGKNSYFGMSIGWQPSNANIDGGLQRFVFYVLPVGEFAVPASIGDGAALFNLQLTFSTPGTYHLGFQLSDGVQDQTCYADEVGVYYYWGTLDHSYTITVN